MLTYLAPDPVHSDICEAYLCTNIQIIFNAGDLYIRHCSSSPPSVRPSVTLQMLGDEKREEETVCFKAYPVESAGIGWNEVLH